MGWRLHVFCAIRIEPFLQLPGAIQPRFCLPAIAEDEVLSWLLEERFSMRQLNFQFIDLRAKSFFDCLEGSLAFF